MNTYFASMETVDKFTNLQNIRSGLSILSTCGDGALLSGTLSVFFGGKCPVLSARSVPFWNDLMTAIHASEVLYTKLPSIQLVILLVCKK